MATLRGQFARILFFMFIATALAALSVQPSRAAPFAAYVMDARTGETLYAKNADTRLHPASLTKMMTLYICFDAIQRGEISLDTMVTVSKTAASQPPSRLGLKAGQRIALRHLIRAAAVKSANDAAWAIGDALSGSQEKFARRMNRTAKALGMNNSTFRNANGLTLPGHLSTAHDMSILGRRLFYDFPQYYNIFSRRETDAGVADVANTNRRFLDSYKGADGIKTGYTVAAGFNLTASAERDDVRIIATVLGGTSTANRNAKMAELLDLGFAKAPKDARSRKPAPADMPAEELALLAEATPDPLVETVGGAGKIIRLVTTLASSPRPRVRPSGGTEIAIAQVQPSDAAAAEAVVLSLQDTINDALAAATEPEPVPFAVVGADGQPLPAPDDAATVTAATAPADAAAVPLDVADAAAVAEPATEVLPDEVAAASSQPALDQLAPNPDLPAVGIAVSQPDTPLPFAIASAEDEAALPPLLPATNVVQLSAEPAAQPEAEQLAALAPQPILRPLPVAAQDDAEPEVVVRLSTSGGRQWGVVLGQFNTRTSAERILMKTGLSESAVLGDGLRKVVQRRGGYEATVLGLTQEQADLACLRLQARAQDCITLGP